MPRTLFFDCFAGASGDMLIGSLLDAGLEAACWQAELAKIALPEGSFTHTIRKVDKNGIAATKFTVFLEGLPADVWPEEAPPHAHDLHPHGAVHAHGHAAHEHPHLGHEPHHHDHEHHHHDHGHEHHHEHRGLTEIETILERSAIDPKARDLAKRIFRNLAVAEGKVHGVPPEQVHFHEVGAVDAIVDITGFAIAYELMGAPRVVVSPLVVGSGMVRCAHGHMPVPVPAVVELLKEAGAPMRASHLTGECLTPTGAAILTTVAAAYAPGVAFQQLEASGYGAGARNQPDVPNVVRALLGEA
ncbi:MAG TPA: LarC family nickel insertion protein [Stenomitos sp.]